MCDHTLIKLSRDVLVTNQLSVSLTLSLSPVCNRVPPHLVILRTLFSQKSCSLETLLVSSGCITWYDSRTLVWASPSDPHSLQVWSGWPFFVVTYDRTFIILHQVLNIMMVYFLVRSFIYWDFFRLPVYLIFKEVCHFWFTLGCKVICSLKVGHCDLFLPWDWYFGAC